MKLWPFSKKTARELSEELRETLLSVFGVGPEAASAMRYFAKSAKLAGRRIKLVCVFDQASIPDARLVDSTYDNMMARKESPLFTGHVFATSYELPGIGGVYLKDLRRS